MDAETLKTTQYVLSYFIRKMEELLLSLHDDNPYYNFEDGIKEICLSFIGDHFMENYGEIIWQIEGDKLSEMLEAANEQKFMSPIHSIGDTKWRIHG